MTTLQSNRTPTKAQQRKLEVLRVQFHNLHWSFGSFDQTIKVIAPGRSYLLNSQGQLTFLHRNYIQRKR